MTRDPIEAFRVKYFKHFYRKTRALRRTEIKSMEMKKENDETEKVFSQRNKKTFLAMKPSDSLLHFAPFLHLSCA